ncbi:hypothetical protein A6P39_022315 [Streptomyces sp. FXJ1.172]|uniref:hypothetical protein n=1 Tax=Streptomyces sp. FXJ1.172 TaxID=710705 RepID=UPI000AC12A47|nr:hypothetical protein [Streptomyces sp. FXJ1.172]WEO96546.1 hypothetical protein A6P39_022315 [Streptomyces sp. FXJ1.172]
MLGGVLAACGGHGPGGGYVAVGAVGGPQKGSTAAVTPTGAVSLVPLDNSPAGPPGSRQPNTSSGAGTGTGPEQTAPPSSGTPGPLDGTSSPSDGTPGPSGPTAGAPSTPASPTPTPAPAPAPAPAPGTTVGPAKLSWGEPATKDTDQRWCQQVTVAFRNTGGTAVRSGSVTFGTHVIGALGIDWATIRSTVDLPVPIAPGARAKPAWTVCVDAWRVPLGMHIETRDVSVQWK